MSLYYVAILCHYTMPLHYNLLISFFCSQKRNLSTGVTYDKLTINVKLYKRNCSLFNFLEAMSKIFRMTIAKELCSNQAIGKIFRMTIAKRLCSNQAIGKIFRMTIAKGLCSNQAIGKIFRMTIAKGLCSNQAIG